MVSEGDENDFIRVQASFTDDTSQLVSANSAALPKEPSKTEWSRFMLLDSRAFGRSSPSRGMVDNAAHECNSNLNDIPRKPAR